MPARQGRTEHVLIKRGLPRSMPYFYGSLKVAITLGFAQHWCVVPAPRAKK